MNKLCKQILASMLPYGVTTLCALRMLPLGDYNVSYLYRMVKKLEDDNLLAERRIKTKTDGREYHHRYLALTEAGLYTLAECAGKEDIAVGTMAPGAIGYGFLSYVGKTDHIPKVQTMPNAGILSLLREKEYEALFARAGMLALPFERPDLSRVLFWYAEKGTAFGKPPNRVAAIIFGALQAWRDEQPKVVDKSLLHPSAPVWFSSRIIQMVVGQPSSPHHSFTTYDGVIWDGVRYTVVYHAGPRGTAWAEDANKRLRAFLDNAFRIRNFMHNAIAVYKTQFEWEALWKDPEHKRRQKNNKTTLGKPFANFFVLPYSRDACVQLQLVVSGGDFPIEKGIKSICKSLGFEKRPSEWYAAFEDGKRRYIALTPSASEMAEMFERYETGDRDWGIVCLQWMEREFWQLFEGIELIPVVVGQK